MISCKEERLEVLCVWESLMTKWEVGEGFLGQKKKRKREGEGNRGLPSGWGGG